MKILHYLNNVNVSCVKYRLEDNHSIISLSYSIGLALHNDKFNEASILKISCFLFQRDAYEEGCQICLSYDDV